MELNLSNLSIPTVAIFDRLPKLSMILQGGSGAGLIIRSGDVEVLSMKGKSVGSRVRVPIQGTEDAQLVEAIRKAISASGLKTKKFVVSIPTQDVLFRSFTIPVLPKNEWDMTVQFEARKFIPFKIETLIWDYRIVPSTVPNRLEVVFAAIQQEVFQRLQHVLAQAGIQPLMIEPRSLSLARLVSAGQDATNEFLCVVDVEQDALNIAIVKNGIPYLTRDVGLSSTSETAAAPPSEGSIAPTPGTPEGEFDGRAQRLMSELSVSIDFFLREYPSSTISRVLLFGEETLIASWCRPLAEQLHCSVELGTALVEPHVRGGIPLSFASGVGLLQARREVGTTLDFLKRNLEKVPRSTQTSTTIRNLSGLSSVGAGLKPAHVMGAGAVVATLLAVYWLIGAEQLSTEHRRLTQLISNRPSVGWGLVGKKAADLKPLQEKAKSQVSLLKQIVDQRVSATAKLDALAHALPNGVWLTSLTFESALDAAGKSQPRMQVKAACYLGEADQELTAIQEFAKRTKTNAALLGGFSSGSLGQIEMVKTRQTGVTYQAFQLSYTSERRL